MMTLAAELEGASSLCRYATKRGTVISLGHQNANEKQVHELCTAGARAVTHLGNGLPHLLNRHQNPLWPSLAEKQLSATIVADGFHLPVSLLKTILLVKGPLHTILVSDLSPVGGLKSGEYQLWGKTVKLEPNGFLHHPQSGYLAASSFPLLNAANYLLKGGLMPISEIYQSGFLNPLRLLGISAASYRTTLCFRSENHELTLEKG
jgi:N-acetylglucosamine-6-phosphate deacetylase